MSWDLHHGIRHHGKFYLKIDYAPRKLKEKISLCSADWQNSKFAVHGILHYVRGRSTPGDLSSWGGFSIGFECSFNEFETKNFIAKLFWFRHCPVVVLNSFKFAHIFCQHLHVFFRYLQSCNVVLGYQRGGLLSCLLISCMVISIQIVFEEIFQLSGWYFLFS